MSGEHKTWQAMIKFADNEQLTEKEWIALSHLTMIDRTKLYFGPGNIRWAQTKTECEDNLKFYKSLGRL